MFDDRCNLILTIEKQEWLLHLHCPIPSCSRDANIFRHGRMENTVAALHDMNTCVNKPHNLSTTAFWKTMRVKYLPEKSVRHDKCALYLQILQQLWRGHLR